MSTEIGIETTSEIAFITGITLCSSNSAEVFDVFRYVIDGRVDSPPISNMWQPSFSNSKAFSTAKSILKLIPSPENESGVRLIMPIT